jgi:hypothetical protein
LITFDNLDLLEGDPTDLPEMMYLRDIDDERLLAIWRAVVRGDEETILDQAWLAFDDLLPYVRDFYRPARAQGGSTLNLQRSGNSFAGANLQV